MVSFVEEFLERHAEIFADIEETAWEIGKIYRSSDAQPDFGNKEKENVG